MCLLAPSYSEMSWGRHRRCQVAVTTDGVPAAAVGDSRHSVAGTIAGAEVVDVEYSLCSDPAEAEVEYMAGVDCPSRRRLIP
jgi:hypothetical protein